MISSVCINFHVHFRLANLSPISSPTSVRSGHCWTSTAGFGLANSSPISSPTSARSGHRWASTAGFRSEWARLDLNRKGLSAVGTAGPQWAPLDLNGQIECQKINGQVEDVPEDMPDTVPEHMPEDMPGRMPEDMPDRMPENMSDRMPENLPVTKCINVMVGITRSKVFF